jgi:hypothetical protein
MFMGIDDSLHVKILDFSPSFPVGPIPEIEVLHETSQVFRGEAGVFGTATLKAAVRLGIGTFISHFTPICG